jgi:hypothetical protein
MNGNDLVEYEEENFDDLIEDFFINKRNKARFEEWLESEGYDLFLNKCCISEWTEHISSSMRGNE